MRNVQREKRLANLWPPQQ